MLLYFWQPSDRSHGYCKRLLEHRADQQLLPEVFSESHPSSLLEQLFFNLDYRKIENLQFEDNDYYYYVEAVPKRYRNDEDSQEMEAGRIDRKGREHHDGHETIHS